MKLRRLLSGVLAATVALTSMVLTPFATASAADEPSDIVFPDSGAWKNTSVINKAKVEISPYNASGNAISALSGKTEFYVTFDVTGVPSGGVRAFIPTVFVGGGTHWNSDDVVPFVEIPEDGTYTAKFTGETIPDNAKLLYLGVNCKKLENQVDVSVGSITLKYVTLSDPNNSVSEVESFDISYYGTNNGGIVDEGNRVTATVYSDNTMVISGKGKTKDFYSSSTQPWSSYPITSVTVEEGVTRLGQYLFNGMTSLESVSLPDSLTDIWKYCFMDCSSLTEVVIPKNVVEMTDSTFENCTSLKKVTVLGPLSANHGFRWFIGCTSLEEVAFASGLPNIPDYSFYGCTNLKSVTIPDTVTSIDEYAFGKCSSLKSITLPNGLKSIDTFAFYRSGLTSITLPNSLTTLGNGVFCDNYDLESVTISEGLSEITQLCFEDCRSLKEVNFPDSVTSMSIGKNAFTDCLALESLSLPNGVTTIGEYAFFDCPSLKSITIPDSVTSIGDSAFLGCEALENCEISSSSKITSIGELAFCTTQIKSITIPAGVTSLGKYAFKGTPLESVTFVGNGLTTIGEYAFRECESLTSIDIPEGVTTIGTQAFYSCGLSSVKLPSTLTTIGDHAFMNNLDLSTIAIPNSVTSLGTGAFDCSGLRGDIIIPESITTLPSYVFKYCLWPSLNVYIMGEITEVGTDPFGECTGKIYVNDVNTYNLIKATDYGTAELIYVGAVDTTDLDAAIAEADAIDTDIYTADSVKALTDAVTAGNAVRENVGSTEEEVAKAAQAIRDAINALVIADVDGIKADLESLVDKIEKLLTVKDESNYTADSWTALNDALKAAKDGLASEETLSYGAYKALYDNLSGAYTGLTTVSTADSEYLGTIYGGYEVTYNHETDSYKVVVSDDVDMDKVVGTTYVKITLTPNKDLSSQLSYGTLNVWNFLDNLEKYGQYANGISLSGTEDNVLTYNLSIPSAESAFSLTAGTGWTKDTEVFYVKSVEFYNANDELLYTYSADSIGTGDVRNLKTAIEKAEAIDKSVYSEESVAVLEAVLEDAKATLNNTSASKYDYRVRASELEAAIAGLKLIVVTGNVSGKIKVSDKNAETEMTVTAVAEDGTKTSVTATSMGTYVIENLAVGEYTLMISGGKYAPRSYDITVETGDIALDVELNPYGDINGDGKVTTVDVGMANSHAKGVKTLEGYEFVCADVKTDGSITTADVGMINSHAKGVKALW